MLAASARRVAVAARLPPALKLGLPLGVKLAPPGGGLAAGGPGAAAAAERAAAASAACLVTVPPELPLEARGWARAADGPSGASSR